MGFGLIRFCHQKKKGRNPHSDSSKGSFESSMNVRNILTKKQNRISALISWGPSMLGPRGEVIAQSPQSPSRRMAELDMQNGDAGCPLGAKIGRAARVSRAPRMERAPMIHRSPLT